MFLFMNLSKLCFSLKNIVKKNTKNHHKVPPKSGNIFFDVPRTVLSGYVFPWTTAACFGLFAMFRAYGAVLYAGDRMARMKGILKGRFLRESSPPIDATLGWNHSIVWYFMFIVDTSILNPWHWLYSNFICHLHLTFWFRNEKRSLKTLEAQCINLEPHDLWVDRWFLWIKHTALYLASLQECVVPRTNDLVTVSNLNLGGIV